MSSRLVFTLFRVFSLNIIAIATILVGVTLRRSAIWDEYKTIVAITSSKYIFRLDAHQNLWGATVRQDGMTAATRAYPTYDEYVETEWREKSLILMGASVAFGSACFLFLLFSAISQYRTPQQTHQVAALVINSIMCIGSGVSAYLGTRNYSECYQKTLRPNVLRHPNEYNPDENILAFDYWLAFTGSIIYGLASVILIAHLVVEIYFLRKKKKTETEVKPFAEYS